MSSLFALRLFGYRLLKPFTWPMTRAVTVPRPTVFVGPDASLRLCASIGQFGYRRVMIVTDAVLVKLGLVEPLRQALLAQGIDVAVHDGITPDPTYPVLQAGYEAVRVHRSDAILAVGGGSAIDAAKVIGAMAVSGKSPAKLVGMLKVGKPMLPLFAIPTTAGTGSEVTVAAVVTDPVLHSKSAVIDPKLVPLAAALDPLADERHAEADYRGDGHGCAHSCRRGLHQPLAACGHRAALCRGRAHGLRQPATLVRRRQRHGGA